MWSINWNPTGKPFCDRTIHVIEGAIVEVAVGLSLAYPTTTVSIHADARVRRSYVNGNIKMDLPEFSNVYERGNETEDEWSTHSHLWKTFGGWPCSSCGLHEAKIKELECSLRKEQTCCTRKHLEV